ncbi:hypothetical protein AAF712_008184 [Marasmius tenuissimus]|uniref:Uncharacterized protein n=1 Tax=Marasmius tenuissimus TaxID=585030 RepID=A0ABR2ZSY7_9AGAR
MDMERFTTPTRMHRFTAEAAEHGRTQRDLIPAQFPDTRHENSNALAVDRFSSGPIVRGWGWTSGRGGRGHNALPKLPRLSIRDWIRTRTLGLHKWVREHKTEKDPFVVPFIIGPDNVRVGDAVHDFDISYEYEQQEAFVKEVDGAVRSPLTVRNYWLCGGCSTPI